jgi:hypothetical protein
MSIDIANTSPEVLNSWKEIARYLDRGVRTVQRWEGDLGLPVRRPHGHGRSAVFAIRADLDAWLRSCPVKKTQENGATSQLTKTPPPQQSIDPAGPTTGTSTNDYRSQTFFVTQRLILDFQQIKQRSLDSREQLKDAILRLRQTMGKMLVNVPQRAEMSSSVRDRANANGR